MAYFIQLTISLPYSGLQWLRKYNTIWNIRCDNAKFISLETVLKFIEQVGLQEYMRAGTCFFIKFII